MWLLTVEVSTEPFNLCLSCGAIGTGTSSAAASSQPGPAFFFWSSFLETMRVFMISRLSVATIIQLRWLCAEAGCRVVWKRGAADKDST